MSKEGFGKVVCENCGKGGALQGGLDKSLRQLCLLCLSQPLPRCIGLLCNLHIGFFCWVVPKLRLWGRKTLLENNHVFWNSNQLWWWLKEAPPKKDSNRHPLGGFPFLGGLQTFHEEPGGRVPRPEGIGPGPGGRGPSPLPQGGGGGPVI